MQYGKGELEILQGDITDQTTDAIVNAANNDLILGAGVAGAIARKGGPTIQEECNRHGPIRVGEAAITGAGNLRCKWVIHAAGMRLGGKVTISSLESCTRASLEICRQRGISSVAFPAIGAGIGGLDIETCAHTMLRIARDHMTQFDFPKKIVFVLWDSPAFSALQKVWEQLARESGAHFNPA
jgi:O-acetyl-ADP-ribose deacetylase (regulator of RNase III)